MIFTKQSFYVAFQWRVIILMSKFFDVKWVYVFSQFLQITYDQSFLRKKISCYLIQKSWLRVRLLQINEKCFVNFDLVSRLHEVFLLNHCSNVIFVFDVQITNFSFVVNFKKFDEFLTQSWWINSLFKIFHVNWLLFLHCLDWYHSDNHDQTFSTRKNKWWQKKTKRIFTQWLMSLTKLIRLTSSDKILQNQRIKKHERK